METDATWAAGMPETYDTHLGPALFQPFADWIATGAAATSPARVLEVAAGTGIATAALVDRLPEAHIEATDLNEAMVTWSADRVRGATWSVADAQSLGFPDASFDLVVCQFGVMFLPDKPAAFAEIARVLTSGGRFLFTVWDSIELSPFPAALKTGVAELYPDDPPDFVVRVPHGYTDQDRIRADLDAGGLRTESTEPLVRPGRAASARPGHRLRPGHTAPVRAPAAGPAGARGGGPGRAHDAHPGSGSGHRGPGRPGRVGSKGLTPMPPPAARGRLRAAGRSRD